MEGFLICGPSSNYPNRQESCNFRTAAREVSVVAFDSACRVDRKATDGDGESRSRGSLSFPSSVHRKHGLAENVVRLKGSAEEFPNAHETPWLNASPRSRGG